MKGQCGGNVAGHNERGNVESIESYQPKKKKKKKRPKKAHKRLENCLQRQHSGKSLDWSLIASFVKLKQC